MAITDAGDQRLEFIRRLMDECAHEFGYKAVDPFGERHGSWERTLFKKSGPLVRYVSVDWTSFEDHDELAIFAGAEDENRFRRIDLGVLRIGPEPVLSETVGRLVRSALQQADQIQASQLNESHSVASTQLATK